MVYRQLPICLSVSCLSRSVSNKLPGLQRQRSAFARATASVVSDPPTDLAVVVVHRFAFPRRSQSLRCPPIPRVVTKHPLRPTRPTIQSSVPLTEIRSGTTTTLSTRSVTRPMLHPVVPPAITPCEAPSDAPFPAPCDAPPATLVEL